MWIPRFKIWSPQHHAQSWRWAPSEFLANFHCLNIKMRISLYHCPLASQDAWRRTFLRTHMHIKNVSCMWWAIEGCAALLSFCKFKQLFFFPFFCFLKFLPTLHCFSTIHVSFNCSKFHERTLNVLWLFRRFCFIYLWCI